MAGGWSRFYWGGIIVLFHWGESIPLMQKIFHWGAMKVILKTPFLKMRSGFFISMLAM